MIRIFLAIALVWLILLPSFFTGGACTAEFDQVARQFQGNKSSLASSESAQAIGGSLRIPVQVISAQFSMMVEVDWYNCRQT